VLQPRSAPPCPLGRIAPRSHTRNSMREATHCGPAPRWSASPAPLRKRQEAVMDIQRALSQGANWVVAIHQIPALLELIDEQQIPVGICLTQGAGTVSLRTESVYCRRCAQSLKLEGPGISVQIDLDRLAEARAVSHAAGARRRISLQLAAESGTALLTITGPTPAEGLAGQVWHLVMESLLPAKLKPRLPRGFAAKVREAPASVQAQKLPYLARPDGWTLPTRRREPAHKPAATGSHG
jgi:hypothetical protein